MLLNKQYRSKCDVTYCVICIIHDKILCHRHLKLKSNAKKKFYIRLTYTFPKN